MYGSIIMVGVLLQLDAEIQFRVRARALELLHETIDFFHERVRQAEMSFIHEDVLEIFQLSGSIRVRKGDG